MPLIQRRINEIQFRFTRLAGRIATGTYKLRRGSPRRGTIAAKPRPDSPFRKQGWLAELLPPSIAAPLRGGLRSLLNNPEMAALIAAAPAPMARIFRPLCWALKYKAPPIPARPRPQPRPAGLAAGPGRPEEKPNPPLPAAKARRGGGSRRPGR
jgi:hypothetical protein